MKFGKKRLVFSAVIALVLSVLLSQSSIGRDLYTRWQYRNLSKGITFSFENATATSIKAPTLTLVETTQTHPLTSWTAIDANSTETAYLNLDGYDGNEYALELTYEKYDGTLNTLSLMYLPSAKGRYKIDITVKEIDETGLIKGQLKTYDGLQSYTSTLE
ncbi:hypothetical protein ACR6HW_09100 [Fusibacter sp. JL298sf-3]